MKRFLALIIIVAVAGFLFWKYGSTFQTARAGEDHFSGTITAFDSGCFADATCSVTVGDNLVILVTGGRAQGDVPQGKVLGVESIGDLANKIGSKANVYAAPTEPGEYSLYGNADYFVQVE